MHLELLHPLPNVGSDTRFPPHCDQALSHHALYLPIETLQRYGIESAQVVQHQNEMIITFPFAYHQGYNTGPNISEEMTYASDRWEIFPKNNLYRRCHEKCPRQPWQSSLCSLLESSRLVGSRNKINQCQTSEASQKPRLHKPFSSENAGTDAKIGKDFKVQPRGRKRSMDDRRSLLKASKARLNVHRSDSKSSSKVLLVT